MINPKIKALFIDLDGTLANSMPLLYKLYKEVMQELGITDSKREFDALVGPKLSEIAKHIVQKHHLTITPETLANQYHAKLRKLYMAVPLFPGAKEFLARAQESAMRLALVTSAEESLAKRFLEQHELDSLFEEIITPDDLTHSKPHPDIYLKALRKMHLKPEEVIAIEDAESGLQAASDAGIHTVAFQQKDWKFLENDFFS